ncbi:hypothetical protein L665_00390 [Ralstonia solanacearum SD54]|nr:hypothetical protein L665_00390 [Ralstonia solanacearum SD54]
MRDAGPFTVAPGHRRVRGLAGVEAALQGHLRDTSGSAVSPARP